MIVHLFVVCTKSTKHYKYFDPAGSSTMFSLVSKYLPPGVTCSNNTKAETVTRGQHQSMSCKLENVTRGHHQSMSSLAAGLG